MKTQTLTNRAAGQSGFTLLELLVVVTLLAILATGALVAYDGADEKAQSSRAANTIGALDQGVRAYRAVTGAYPNQWDNLADPLTADQPAGVDFNGPDEVYIPSSLQNILGSLDLRTALEGVYGASTVDDDFMEDFFVERFGFDEIQHVMGTGIGTNGKVEPNRVHNEGTNPFDGTNGALETEFGDFGGDVTFISVLASDAFDDDDDTQRLSCTVGGQSLARVWGDTDGNGTPGQATDIADPLVINSINDALSTERCNLVLAVGFGGDAAQSTVDSSAGVVQAPTYTSKNVNPANQYARYIGLFLLAKGNKGNTGDGDGVENLVDSNFLARPRLLGFIDTEGNTIDMNIAEATRD
ncbi:prepilin-type N-terminal cleavage/methylation domain-containing protein [Methylotuvimicrobium sp. KM2]|uniref:prepilin-type N-terminal cleavage/methylation domain-containing protein n=1 Tax=Methylotuvimicrobium sp. KM2 TaxID=3133976 RepID=UPI0031015B45